MTSPKNTDEGRIIHIIQPSDERGNDAADFAGDPNWTKEVQAQIDEAKADDDVNDASVQMDDPDRKEKNEKAIANCASSVKPEPILWRGITPPTGFKLSDSGVRFIPEDDDANPQPVTHRPVWVAAISRDTDRENWGSLVCWTDRDGHLHERAIAASLFHAQGTELAQQLASGGLPIVSGKERKLLQYLTAFDASDRLVAATATGWHGLAFVLPDGSIGEAGGERIVFQPSGLSDAARAMKVSGTAAEWREGMRDASSAVVFATSVSLSTPIRYLAGIESGGFHLFEMTSTGKTTLLQVAASVWGNGVDPQMAGGAAAYIQRWNATANALEAKAECFNDLPLIIDEIGEGESLNFGQTIYRLMSGTGRSRSRKDGSAAAQRSWRTTILSAGELPVSEYVAESGKSVRGGQLVRLVDVRITRAFETAQQADAMKRLCSEHYGHAGRELLASGDLLDGWNDIDLAAIGDAHTPEANRVRMRFALVCHAGMLAARRGIVPWTENQVRESVRTAFASWRDSSSGASDAGRGVENIRDFILRYDARFERDSDRIPPDRAGWYRDDLYHFTPKAFAEACGGASTEAVKNALFNKGLLHTSEGRRYTSRISVGGKKVRVISIKSELLIWGGNPGNPGNSPHWNAGSEGSHYGSHLGTTGNPDAKGSHLSRTGNPTGNPSNAGQTGTVPTVPTVPTEKRIHNSDFDEPEDFTVTEEDLRR